MFYSVKKLIAALVFFVFSSSVFAASPYADFFNQYESEYRSAHSYIPHEISRNGYQLHAREFGTRHSKPTIIMMHGFPDSLHLYDLVAPKVAEDQHVVTFDFLGWGDSEKPVGFDYTIAEQITDLETVISYFDLQQVILVMHDASGPPAIDWALANKDKVAGLILLNTYYGPMEKLRIPEVVEFFATPSPEREPMIELMSANDEIWLNGYIQQLNTFFAREKNKETFIKILAHQSLDIRPAFFSLTAKLFPDVAERAERVNELTEFDRPVRIIFGANDPYLNIYVATEFYALFPQSELFLIRNAGHFVQLDKPNRVAELITEFFDQLTIADEHTEAN